MELTEKSAKQVAAELDALIEAAKLLYLSDKEISPALAEVLGEVWELSQDYIEMYENLSRL